MLIAGALLLTGCPRTRPTQAPEAAPAPSGPTASTPRSTETPPPTCATGDSAACLAEGRALETEAPDSPDASEQARQRYDRGCELGLGPACAALARNLATRQPDAPAVTAALERGCALEHAPSCGRLALHLHHGRGVAEDRPRARALFEASCASDHGPACRNLGLLMHDDPAGAARAFTRACELEDPPGCAGLGHARYSGRGTSTDLDGALRAYERACEGDLQLACESAERLRLEITRVRGPYRRGVVRERDGTRLVLDLEDLAPIPENVELVIWEWAIRNDARDWYEVADVTVHARDGETLELRIRKYRDGIRTDDYIPLLPKSGVRLQWRDAAVPSS